MGLPTYAPNFNSPVQGSVWFTISQPRGMVFVTQFDVLVRRLQEAIRRYAPGEYRSRVDPRVTRRGSAVSVDGRMGPATIDGLAELMRMSGDSEDRISRMVSDYTRGGIFAGAPYLAWHALFFNGTGSDVPKRAVSFAPGPPISLPGGVSRVVSPAAIQQYVGFYPIDTNIAPSSPQAAVQAAVAQASPGVPVNFGGAPASDMTFQVDETGDSPAKQSYSGGKSAVQTFTQTKGGYQQPTQVSAGQPDTSGPLLSVSNTPFNFTAQRTDPLTGLPTLQGFQLPAFDPSQYSLTPTQLQPPTGLQQPGMMRSPMMPFAGPTFQPPPQQGLPTEAWVAIGVGAVVVVGGVAYVATRKPKKRRKAR